MERAHSKVTADESATAEPAKDSGLQFKKSKALQLRKKGKLDPRVHILKGGFVCDTDTRGYATPKGQSGAELVVHASEGFIPLWEKDTILRWRFKESSLSIFESPAGAKGEIRKLMAEAILAWGDAAPVRFREQDDAWDFEVVVLSGDECSINGCVLAKAFFPDPGRHELIIYPKMFEQTRVEQVETLTHEIGHIFGLRHFFADLKETAWPVEIFGTHSAFSIMNYGDQSTLTADDKADLKLLYQLVWSGQLTAINGTSIRLMRPYHTAGVRTDNVVEVTHVRPVVQPPVGAAARRA